MQPAPHPPTGQVAGDGNGAGINAHPARSGGRHLQVRTSHANVAAFFFAAMKWDPATPTKTPTGSTAEPAGEALRGYGTCGVKGLGWCFESTR